MNIRDTFRKNVRRKRHELGMTQQKLADEANLSYSYISEIERGVKEPSLEVAQRIASALKTGLDGLVAAEETSSYIIKDIVSMLQKSPAKKLRAVKKVIQALKDEEI